ncbi:xanthine dehydrogenase molybdopterin binding subunit [Nodosilinea sp. P-1105]|uniref:xanthine dehydrogenase molybdopterin binding subunit n=1 Tax=Nodosilinea sp. P-1105 TaxID=2546229 RepID=UPI001469EADB|nr:xanthine dehydrogenase molybdopterin binding subunit [Nodosilinea sp. P-1105]NMF86339.1 xanthine dehydrogenase molybdopterin binding subunit [Nodosilinea sp. P-1105]
MSPVGKPKSHESAVGHVSGTAVYTDDQREPAGMLSLYPVLSPHAHATITRLEVAPALAVPGCVTVLTAADVPGENNTGVIIHDEVLLPTDEVVHYGQVVAWAVGETEAAAREAAAHIQVEYDPLPAIKTVHEAIAADSYHNDPQIIRRGDTEAALAQATHSFAGEVDIGGQDHFYLETQASWVIPDGEGNLQVFASTQHPTETQEIVARVLGLPKNQVVCTCLRMGGGFGGKESQANPFAAAAALATYKTGRPARCRLRRHQDMLITGKRHGFFGQYEVGFDDQGKITAMNALLVADGGWSLDLSPPVLMRAMLHVDNAYYVPNLVVEGRIAKTNRVSNTAYRGFGGPQGMIVVEEVVDRIARTLNLPPDVVRERNFYYGEGETCTTHYGQEIVDNRLDRVWAEAKQQSDYMARRAAIAAFNETNLYQKRGLAITPVKFGISFNKVQYNQAGALVLIYTDGSIQVNHGGTEMGQGLHTKMIQVAAKALGVNIERIRLMSTSTDKVPNTSATAASSGSDLNGQAVKNACEILRDRLAVVAVRMLNLDAPEDMVFEDDWIYCRTYPSARIAFDEVVQQTYSERISLSATGFYRTPNIFWDAKLAKGRPFYYFAYGAAVSEVEVDGFTGTFKLRQVDIVHDVGESINPLVDRGQIEGGFVQGMGWLTMEELVWDGEGRLRTFAPSTYKIPTISEVPEKFTIHLLQRAAQDGVIYGSKAVGEPPFMLAMSVREAIRAAVAAFGDADFVPLGLPATPEATLWAIERVKAAVSQGQPVNIVS